MVRQQRAFYLAVPLGLYILLLSYSVHKWGKNGVTLVHRLSVDANEARLHSKIRGMVLLLNKQEACNFGKNSKRELHSP